VAVRQREEEAEEEEGEAERQGRCLEKDKRFKQRKGGARCRREKEKKS
jgi:hypothetical protein